MVDVFVVVDRKHLLVVVAVVVVLICTSSRSVRSSSKKTTSSSKLVLEDVEVNFIVILGDDLQELTMLFFGKHLSDDMLGFLSRL